MVGLEGVCLFVLVGYVLGLFPTSKESANTARVRRERIPNF